MNLAPELLFGVCIVVLLGGLIYAAIRYKTRDRRLDPVSEAAAKRNYETTTRDDADEPASPEEQFIKPPPGQ